MRFGNSGSPKMSGVCLCVCVGGGSIMHAWLSYSEVSPLEFPRELAPIGSAGRFGFFDPGREANVGIQRGFSRACPECFLLTGALSNSQCCLVWIKSTFRSKTVHLPGRFKLDLFISPPPRPPKFLFVKKTTLKNFQHKRAMCWEFLRFHMVKQRLAFRCG